MNHRQMPVATDVEKHVLGATLVFGGDSLSLVVERLQEDDFWDSRHAAVYGALRDAHARGVSLELLGVRKALDAAGRLEAAGGEAYLMELSSEVVSDAGIENHIQILREYSSRRKMIKALGENLEAAFDMRKPTAEVLEKAEADILAAGESKSRGSELKSMAEVLASASKGWQDVINGKPAGLMSKIGPVDDLLMGFRPGKLYVLAARPGVGKSMLALQIAMQCGQPVANYSLEMMTDEQAERMVSQESNLDSESLRSANTLLSQGPALALAVQKLGKLPMRFGADPGTTPAQILGQCRRMKKKHGLGLIIVDYLQLIKSPGKFERRDLEVGAVAKFLKAIAMKLEVPVITIASLSRKPEERTDKRPLLSDLRESGDIESDADCVMFLYRESDYNAEAKKNFPNVTELIVSKNRGGRKGRSILNFDGAHSKYHELEQGAVKSYLEFIGKKGTNDQTQSKTSYPGKVSSAHSQFYQG